MNIEIVNPNAAGIDIGSRSHYVAIGQGLDDIKKFGITHRASLKTRYFSFNNFSCNFFFVYMFMSFLHNLLYCLL